MDRYTQLSPEMQASLQKLNMEREMNRLIRERNRK